MAAYEDEMLSRLTLDLSMPDANNKCHDDYKQHFRVTIIYGKNCLFHGR